MAMRRGGSAQDDEEAELNMTPMLDVVFILLIFFIVTAVFVKEPGIEVVRPELTNIDRVKPTILVAVSRDDEIWVNKRLYTTRDLKPALESLRAENPKAEAIVQGDIDAKYSIVHEVMQTLTEVGIDVQFVSAED